MIGIKNISKYKREFVYSSFLFLIFELLAARDITYNPLLYILTSVAGLVLVTFWIMVIHIKNGSKKVSRWSDVLLKVSFKDKFYANILLPIIFYISICIFIFFDISIYLNQIVIVLSVYLLSFLIVTIKKSYEKVFSVNKGIRVLQDFINLIIYFLFISAIFRTSLNELVLYILIVLGLIYVLSYMLISRRRLDYTNFFITLVISVLILSFVIYLKQFVFLSIPNTSTVLLYTVVTIWHTRLEGGIKLVEYIPIIMYSLMALILILSL